MEELHDEFTEKMHSEFTVSKETDIYLRAGVVWERLSLNPPRKDVEKMCKEYGITYEDAMKYKDEWQNLIDESIDRNLL